MKNNLDRLTFCYGNQVITVDFTLMPCRVPIARCPTHEVVCLHITPNVSKMCELRKLPLDPVLEEVYSFSKELVIKELGLPDDVFIDVMERQSTGEYVVLKCPKRVVLNRLFDM